MNNLSSKEQYELYFYLEQYRLCEQDPVYRENAEIEFDLASVYHEVSIRYFEMTGKKLDISKEESQKELYEWLHKTERYHLLTEELKLLLKGIVKPNEYGEEAKTDYFLVTNLSALVSIMNSEGIGYLNEKIEYNPANLKYYSDREIDMLVEEIIQEIDPTGKWLSIYKKAQDEGNFFDYLSLPVEIRRHYQSVEDPDGSLNATFLTTGGHYSIITRKNTLEDVATILHEFTHYIYYEQNEKGSILTLREFAPIFYEKYALLSLQRKGYPLDELLAIDGKRSSNTVALASSNSCLYKYLSMLLNEGTVREECDISYQNRTRSKLLEVFTPQMKQNIRKNFPEFFDSTKFAHMNCDTAVTYLIRYPSSFYQEYSYVIGTYFANKAINNYSKDPSILTRMKDYTEKANELDPYDIFVGIGGEPQKLGITPIDQDLKKSIQKKKSLF